MALRARWFLVLLAALAGLASELRVDLAAARADDCCVEDACCCAAQEAGCCEAQPDEGPRWMARCACGRHGEGSLLALGRVEWTQAVRIEVAPPASESLDYGAAPVARLCSHRGAPEAPPPRS